MPKKENTYRALDELNMTRHDGLLVAETERRESSLEWKRKKN